MSTVVMCCIVCWKVDNEVYFNAIPNRCCLFYEFVPQFADLLNLVADDYLLCCSCITLKLTIIRFH